MGDGRDGECLYRIACVLHVCARKSKCERQGACVFACGSSGGTLFPRSMCGFDIPAPPVSVHKGLSPGFDVCGSAAGLER